ncbi:MAG: type II toxin-antitoxin system PemK/MazF family toxin [Thermoanaerobaculia bacterium]
MRRGEVYWANILPRFGSEQKGRRLALVVSHNAFNRIAGWRSVIVVPISTSTSRARRGPTAVPLPVGAGGLNRPSVALCHQVTTIDRANLEKRLGLLTPLLLKEIGLGLRAAMDLEPESAT